ncbi:NAD-dependent epimerase/dehydratase family protein, partial [Listeria booriae]
SESYVISYSHLFGLKTSAARFFNVYGPRQNPESPYSGVLSILTNCIQKVVAGDEKVAFTLYGDGSQVRDFVYVDDIVNGLILLAGDIHQSYADISKIKTIGYKATNTLKMGLSKYNQHEMEQAQQSIGIS